MFTTTNRGQVEILGVDARHHAPYKVKFINGDWNGRDDQLFDSELMTPEQKEAEYPSVKTWYARLTSNGDVDSTLVTACTKDEAWDKAANKLGYVSQDYLEVRLATTDDILDFGIDDSKAPSGPIIVTGEDAKNLIRNILNPPAPTPELIELMRRRNF